MNQRVEKFIEEAKSRKRQEYERERDELLVKLGLTEEEKVYSDDAHLRPHSQWDAAKRAWYYLKPIAVSDEEYEEIKKWAPCDKADTPSVKINNRAEKVLRVFNVITLIISVVLSLILLMAALNTYKYRSILMVVAIAILLLALVGWAKIKVVLNISNNLHRINAKQK